MTFKDLFYSPINKIIPSEEYCAKEIITAGFYRNIVVFDNNVPSLITENLLRLMNQNQTREIGKQIDLFFIPEWAHISKSLQDEYNINIISKEIYNNILSTYKKELLGSLVQNHEDIIIGITFDHKFLFPVDKSDTKYILLGCF